jgi:hypothetical protein
VRPLGDGVVVAIHQPNFFPWLGYFDKLAKCDKFVVLDTAQLQKKGGSWVNRVKLAVGGEGQWVTAAIDRNYRGVRAIGEIRFDEPQLWRAKFIKTLTASYAKRPFFAETMDMVAPLIDGNRELLANFNNDAIASIADAIGLDKSKIMLASELRGCGAGTELLIDLTRRAGGTAYLCGGGAQGYQDDQAFADAELDLIYQDFNHPSYPQSNRPGAFMPGLSIIDALMNVGIDGTRALLSRAD